MFTICFSDGEILTIHDVEYYNYTHDDVLVVRTVERERYEIELRFVKYTAYKPKEDA